MPVGIVAILVTVSVTIIGWCVMALIENHKTDKRDLEKTAEVLSKIDLNVRDLKELKRAATVLQLSELRGLIKEVERGVDQCTGELQARLRTVAGLLRKYVVVAAPAVDDVCTAFLAVSRAEDVPADLTVEFLVVRSEEQALLRPQLEAAVASAEMRMRRLRLGV